MAFQWKTHSSSSIELTTWRWQMMESSFPLTSKVCFSAYIYRKHWIVLRIGFSKKTYRQAKQTFMYTYCQNPVSCVTLPPNTWHKHGKPTQCHRELQKRSCFHYFLVSGLDMLMCSLSSIDRRDRLQETQNVLNEQHTSINFTMETEKNGKLSF